MARKILLIIGIVLIAFFGFVSTRNGQFRYERSGVINASADKIFPFISDFRKGHLWSPYEQKDSNMKKTYSGPEAQPGFILEFDGNNEVGSGKLKLLKLVPNQSVDIKLTMIKPFHAENSIQYLLSPEGTGTRFTWIMSGDGGFLGKLFSLLFDCEKMVASDFEKGIKNLKVLVESQK